MSKDPIKDAAVALSNVNPGDDAAIRKGAELLIATSLAVALTPEPDYRVVGEPIPDLVLPPVVLTPSEVAGIYLHAVQMEGNMLLPMEALHILENYTWIRDKEAMRTFLSQREVVVFKWDYLGDEIDQVELINNLTHALLADPDLQVYYPEGIRDEMRKYRYLAAYLEHVIMRKIPRHHPALVRHCKQFNEDWAAYFINQGQDPEDENPLLEIEVLPVATFYIAKESNGNEYVVTGQQMTSALHVLPE